MKINSNVNKPKVIAISGASGSGKTSIVQRLSEQLNSPRIFFDNYIDADTYPRDMQLWFHQGADVCQITTPRFVRKLESLLCTHKTDYIFIEEPFGKKRQLMAALIDYVVLLDPPLDICLDRLLKRGEHKNAQQLSDYMDKYNQYFRDIYLETVNQIRPSCDLVISEQLPISAIVDRIINWLKSEKLS